MTLQFEGVGFDTGTGAGGKIGTVALVAMGSEPSTPYTVGSKWFYNGLIYTATSTTAHDSGVVPSYDTAYLYNGTYYYWDGSALQGADESNLVHISGTETITGDKTFSGSVALGDNASAQTKPTSDTSDAVATTQFVKDFAQDGEWQKPADWIDIRSGALENSAYFLVAHSKPVVNEGVYEIATYPKFALFALVSTDTNTYDVFVDGIKIATTANNTATVIDWATLYNNGIIASGYDISSPGNSGYTTHVVKVTPSINTDTLTGIRSSAISGQTQQGILWVHFEIDYAIRIISLLGGENNPRNLLCQAVTAKNDTLLFVNAATGSTGLYQVFTGASSLVKVPVLEQSGNDNYESDFLCFSNVPAKKIKIKNLAKDYSIRLLHGFKGEYIETDTALRLYSVTTSAGNASGAYNLKKLPAISTEKTTTLIMSRLDSIEPTFIDESFNDERTLLRIYGESGHITNLVGLVVSNEAPFDYATAPQLSVNYTNMDRAALVRLFQSLPYNVGYEVVGSLTVEDGVASGFSASDYLKLEKLPDFSGDVEIVIKFNANTFTGDLMSWLTNGIQCFVKFNADKTLNVFFASMGDNTTHLKVSGSFVFSENTDYYVKIVKTADNTLSVYYSTDGTSYTLDETTQNANAGTIVLSSYYRIGVSSAYTPADAFDGTIDLSKSYIKTKGLPFFRGTAAMTKSISVVGATGTADLTADDKAIAENKGWSIVLA